MYKKEMILQKQNRMFLKLVLFQEKSIELYALNINFKNEASSRKIFGNQKQIRHWG